MASHSARQVNPQAPVLGVLAVLEALRKGIGKRGKESLTGRQHLSCSTSWYV